MIDADSADYQAGFKDGLKSEKELRKAAAQLIILQKQERKHRNKNLHNQARSLLGEWLEIFSKSRWEEGSQYTIHKMAHYIAESWEEESERINTNDLIERREQYSDACPDGVLVVTAGVDVQADRLEVLVCGHGKADELWFLEHRIFYGSPASDVTFPVTDCANNIIGVSRVIIIAIRLRLFISNLLVIVEHDTFFHRCVYCLSAFCM